MPIKTVRKGVKAASSGGNTIRSFACILFHVRATTWACCLGLGSCSGFRNLKPGPSPLQALVRARLGSGLNGPGSAGSGLEAQPGTSLMGSQSAHRGGEYEHSTSRQTSVLGWASALLWAVRHPEEWLRQIVDPVLLAENVRLYVALS
ncbi:hypothetical protein PILCRDRAFT_5006 [Piloderma croceum F 1598]|uniref:Uncharacterized protein n=1 Tax=Piloderma croceum (strain F 1598) TaxID=765440 RepID=A0A0C3BHU8_PILCF|nr:hypothetical protein PILCRDRAFT_5006 [Piloderma croceum F 1598]